MEPTPENPAFIKSEGVLCGLSPYGELKIQHGVVRKVSMTEVTLNSADIFMLNYLLFPRSYGGNNPQDKVTAIKFIRLRFGFGLKEAKDIVDTILEGKTSNIKILEN